MSSAISDRKRAANRANAAKSTGPRTIEGKKRSAANAIKHGLRAEIVVLPTEDVAAFEASRDAWIADWQPASEAAATLVERAVAGAWRLRRCVRLETDRLAERGRRAVEAREEEVGRRLEVGRGMLEERPGVGVEFLRMFWEGLDFLRGEWRAIVRAASLPGGWVDWEGHHVRAMNLMGHEVDSEAADARRFAAASMEVLAFHGGAIDRDLYPNFQGPKGGPDRSVIDGSLAKILRLGYARIDALEAELAAMIHPESDRARVADAAALDDSLEGVTLARYEATHDRAFRATLNALIKMTDRDGSEERFDEVDATNEPTEVATLASDRPATSEATEVAVVPRPRPAPNEPTATGVDERPAPSAPNEPTGGPSVMLRPSVSPNEPTDRGVDLDPDRPGDSLAGPVPNEATDWSNPS